MEKFLKKHIDDANISLFRGEYILYQVIEKASVLVNDMSYERKLNCHDEILQLLQMHICDVNLILPNDFIFLVNCVIFREYGIEDLFVKNTLHHLFYEDKVSYDDCIVDFMMMIVNRKMIPLSPFDARFVLQSSHFLQYDMATNDFQHLLLYADIRHLFDAHFSMTDSVKVYTEQGICKSEHFDFYIRLFDYAVLYSCSA